MSNKITPDSGLNSDLSRLRLEHGVSDDVRNIKVIMRSLLAWSLNDAIKCSEEIDEWKFMGKVSGNCPENLLKRFHWARKTQAPITTKIIFASSSRASKRKT